MNTIFNWFDTDKNGTFNDEEWAKKENYIQDLQTKLNTEDGTSKDGESKVVKFYHKKFNDINKKIEQLNHKVHKIYEKENYFIKSYDFEKVHNIELKGYINKSEIPEGAISVDISMFEMGILDDKGEYFTGKCYEKGYINFPEDISEEDKKTFLDLFKKAQKQTKEVQKYMQKWEKLDKEYYTALEYYDMAKSGIIDKIGSQEYETQKHQQYQSICNSSNPYYKQYKEIETKFNTLRLKAHRTEAEEAQSRTNIYSAEVAFKSKKAGTISAEYRYTDTKSKVSCAENTNEHFGSLKYLLPLDVINSWFKRK